MKKIWVVQYNDGTSDVFDTETPSPAWPYVDAFDVQDETSKLRLDLEQMTDKAVKLEQALIARDRELAESERHRQILTQQNAEFLADRALPPRERSACVGCSLPKDLDMVAIELEKATQILSALYDMKSTDEWGPYALRNGQLHIRCLVVQRAREEAEAEVKRLTKIVDAPRKCDVCGNYVGNSSAVLGEG